MCCRNVKKNHCLSVKKEWIEWKLLLIGKEWWRCCREKKTKKKMKMKQNRWIRLSVVSCLLVWTFAYSSHQLNSPPPSPTMRWIKAVPFRCYDLSVFIIVLCVCVSRMSFHSIWNRWKIKTIGTEATKKDLLSINNHNQTDLKKGK